MRLAAGLAVMLMLLLAWTLLISWARPPAWLNIPTSFLVGWQSMNIFRGITRSKL